MSEDIQQQIQEMQKQIKLIQKEKNKSIQKQKNKQFYEKRKNDKTRCDLCDMEFDKYNMKNHLQTKKHLANLANMKNEDDK